MNKTEKDIMNTLLDSPFLNQRDVAERSGYSLGMVNRSIRSLCHQGYLDEKMVLTAKARMELQEKKPRNAIILAAGYGMRMVPINTEVSKGLLKVHGEPLIERLIRQLHEVDITEIHIVVGYMKEQYEYLIDEYGVDLIVNMEYSGKNNLHSLLKAQAYLSNSYIVPCDLWCGENPFRKNELYSWYMVSSRNTRESMVRVNRKKELVSVSAENDGNKMIGICYLLEEQAAVVRERIKKMSDEKMYDNSFWEDALFENGRMITYARVNDAEDIVEINTYEQLRELDDQSGHLQTAAISEIAEALQVNFSEIVNIQVLKKGMTNRSFLFECRGERYIMRVPGEGTDRLINRQQEAAVYSTLKDVQICDEVVYLNGDNGFKITKYIENTHTCSADNWEEVKCCMDRLRTFHEMKLSVKHGFDPFTQIQYYETLWGEYQSVYRDYYQTKHNILSLKSWIDEQPKEIVLSHIDSVPDNFLFFNTGDKEEKIYLIDWEYAGMQDPHIDIAMFGIYALYDRKQIDRLIDIYFQGECSEEIRLKIYGYIAVCGLLWSNWCEYKRSLGVEFGEYALRQYRYAKEYYRIVQKYLQKGRDNKNE